MFKPTQSPRIFALPPGVDFAQALIDGLHHRLSDHPLHAIGRVQLIVNTRRAGRRLRDIFDAEQPGLMPKIGLVTDLGEKWRLPDLPDPVPSLRRRLELMQMVSGLMRQDDKLAPKCSAFELADSLAGLMDEMHGEGVTPDVIDGLDISDQSGHWERIRAFLTILRPFFEDALTEPDVETRQRLVIEHLIRHWQDNPPDHPIILAGSTGSRGATRLLMQAIAKLPQGAVVLPGFDFDMPDKAWAALDNRVFSEDHPQYRFHALLKSLDLTRDDVKPWYGSPPANPARNRLLSLALRPAPVTDDWLTDGPELGPHLSDATQGLSLIEAPTPRAEALTIAMILRQAAEDERTAALITPDRMLTRQVAAALDRWSIRPDDSAGTPLQLSAPGRFLRHVADLFQGRLTADLLLTVLKHPLTHRGAKRGEHLRLTHELELHIRKHGPPYPDADSFRDWAMGQKDPMAVGWAEWLGTILCDQEDNAEHSLSNWLDRHVTLAETIATGSQGGGTGPLWTDDAGEVALDAVETLKSHADAAGDMGAREYAALFSAHLSRHAEVRDTLLSHPGIRIWGTLEARIQTADIIILAGLNEGVWPETPTPDPWLNRALRVQAGLLLPERQIGLAAHDFQQAAASAEVWLSRSLRSDEAETVPSRWLNRLQNLLGGLRDHAGPDILTEMRARGAIWLHRARLLEEPGHIPKAPRPAPCPPATARPDKLSVTEIQRLIRDPYSIYAKHVLNLKPLNPLMREPDALLRGIVLHDVLDQFIRETRDNPAALTQGRLLGLAREILNAEVPWAGARALWFARLERVAEKFLQDEHARRRIATPTEFEARGKLSMGTPPFTLTAKADRIDLDANGNVIIYDYKTGAPPTAPQQRRYDKQLLLEAVIAENAGFGKLAPAPVLAAQYLSLNAEGKISDAPLDETPTQTVWAEFCALIAAYADPKTGYVARRAMHSLDDISDYDHLARFGEWDITDPPHREALS